MRDLLCADYRRNTIVHWIAGAMTLVECAGFFNFGVQAIMNNYQAMCYRTEMRGTGMGVALGLNRIGGIPGPVIVGVVAPINPDLVWHAARPRRSRLSGYRWRSRSR